jgi:hypothetical protein
LTRTPQDFVSEVRTSLPQAYEAAGINPNGLNNWDDWAASPWASVQKSRWYSLYFNTGLTQFLSNSILLYFDLPSIGYDQPDTRKKYGDQLRNYIGYAQSVFDSAISMLGMLQLELYETEDDTMKQALSTKIMMQENVARSNAANLKTQKDTLTNSLAAGTAL